AQGVDFGPWFRRLHLPPAQPLIVGQPEFAQAAFRLIRTAPLSTWKAYLRWVVLHAVAEALPARFYQENFAFFHHVLEGVDTPPERWRVVVLACVGDLNASQPLAMAAGKFYVQRMFPPAAKAKILEMVENIRTAFEERIQQSSWMGASTKAKALEKLRAMNVKMGYPDHWQSYSALKLGQRPFSAQVLACKGFEARRNLAKLGHPMDRSEWWMPPSMRNAMYNPTMNDITFPAGILQPPYFDPNADDAANYGAIGVVIGHEMTHGFDAGGRKYDAQGNLNDWWSPEDARAFEAKTRLLAQQYDQYEPLPGLHINGKATLSENIADLGGVEMAFHAWKNALRGRPSPILDGFTGEQRFFLGFAQAWRARFREAYLRTYLQQEVHSPAQFRVLGSVRNVPEFRSAFECRAPGSPSTEEKPVLTLW
ncbi:MAG TPA: M13 family metallopeptidase, partial [Holophagaceae bacterium]